MIPQTTKKGKEIRNSYLQARLEEVTMSQKQIVTIDNAVTYIGKAKSTIYSYIRQGKLTSTGYPKVVVVDEKFMRLCSPLHRNRFENEPIDEPLQPEPYEMKTVPVDEAVEMMKAIEEEQSKSCSVCGASDYQTYDCDFCESTLCEKCDCCCHSSKKQKKSVNVSRCQVCDDLWNDEMMVACHSCGEETVCPNCYSSYFCRNKKQQQRYSRWDLLDLNCGVFGEEFLSCPGAVAESNNRDRKAAIQIVEKQHGQIEALKRVIARYMEQYDDLAIDLDEVGVSVAAQYEGRIEKLEKENAELLEENERLSVDVDKLARQNHSLNQSYMAYTNIGRKAATSFLANFAANNKRIAGMIVREKSKEKRMDKQYGGFGGRVYK